MVIQTDSTNILTIALENIGVYRSIDSGLTWANVPLPQSEGIGRIELSSSVANPNRIYAFGANYFSQSTMGVWRSDDGGASFYATMLRSEGGPNLHGWTSDGSDYSGQAWWDMCIAVDPFDENKIVLGGVNLWGSNDQIVFGGRLFVPRKTAMDIQQNVLDQNTKPYAVYIWMPFMNVS